MTLCLWSCSWFHKDPLRAYLMREHMRQSPWTAKLGRCCRLLRLEGAELRGQRGHEEPPARRPLLPRPRAPEVDVPVSLRPRRASPEPTAWEVVGPRPHGGLHRLSSQSLPPGSVVGCPLPTAREGGRHRPAGRMPAAPRGGNGKRKDQPASSA